jgi:hypothetical protein
MREASCGDSRSRLSSRAQLDSLSPIPRSRKTGRDLGPLWSIKTLFPSKRNRAGLVLASSRAKDGAISPRLANRYSRFALSHRSCDDGSRRVCEGEQRVERSQAPQSLGLRCTRDKCLPLTSSCGRLARRGPDFPKLLCPFGVRTCFGSPAACCCSGWRTD